MKFLRLHLSRIYHEFMIKNIQILWPKKKDPLNKASEENVYICNQ